jgi:hypothetical protein
MTPQMVGAAACDPRPMAPEFTRQRILTVVLFASSVCTALSGCIVVSGYRNAHKPL